MKKTYSIKLIPKTAFHINAGTGSDQRRIFVKSNGEAYIPATLLKGMMRNQAEVIIKTLDSSYTCKGKENADCDCDCIICKMFGKAGFRPSRIVVDNLYLPPNDKTKREIRTNIAVSRYSKCVREGALVSQETVSRDLCFEGNMTVYYTKDMLKYEKLIKESLKMIDSLGSSKSRGLGWVEIEVEEND